ncbi:hypothetical protein ABZ647_17755 [Micromonospora aurantiaca]|uniref:hypothetical protein n=1 Tax=Micromonospora aurantiaca (nom. illeg.) TaxID=47850 RepID=UPI0033F83C75
MHDKQTCTATSKRTHERCKNYPPPGGVVCRFHGGATPQAKRKAAVRLALRELITDGDPRHPWQVLLDALHVSDSLMREAVVQLGTGEPITPQQLTTLVDSIERASRLAKVTLDARAQEHMQLQLGREAELVAHVLNAAIEAAGLDLDQEARARAAMRHALEALDGRPPVIDGTVSQNRALTGGSTS